MPDMDKIDAALKEGIDFDNPPLPGREEAKVDDKQASVSSADSVGNKDQNASVSEKTVDPSLKSEDNQPFHKHPRFKQVLSENKQFKQELQAIKQQYEVAMARIQAGQTAQTPGIPDEQRQAIIQLAKLFKQTPEFAQELGLDKISMLQQENEKLKSDRLNESYTSERGKIESYAKEQGLDTEDIMDELDAFIDGHGVYSQIDYKPGLLQAAFRDMMWDRIGELKERAINLKQLEEKKKLKAGNTEQPNSATKAQLGRKRGVDTAEDMAQLIADAGGEENIDFNA